ncbi:DUF2561 family protein [Mycobacterium shinjukuense]|uniref:Uncharacterized protein n=1 Tax=Mycobacterium shinjukuense TaxID=398694 RepID=A0A7I7MPE1_9MYCO|nr:DUF2561 family protein [Mycobacterium shinjukuense]MCV6984925.1 DUF2561 family protein [Mycobacterium shinjukuense]ORB70369.1 hypothetical protein BST45_06245 [Mycobacterium shinjukuense]BBX73169.1 hypothetical protein MSHI_10750 [Mycobacterium shinjukuense]
MVGRYSAYRRGPDPIVPPDVIDRILIGACAAVWLLLVGVSVAAAVALADLGRGFHGMARNSHTTWILYAVIGVSALIIAGAIPMLLRARRMAREAEPVARTAVVASRGAGRPAPRTAAGPARPAAVNPYGAAAEWSGEAVDRVWLRGTVALTGTIGAALIAVAAASYLMAVGHDGASWVSYGLAGVITAGLPVLEWLHVRQLRRLLATSG